MFLESRNFTLVAAWLILRSLYETTGIADKTAVVCQWEDLIMTKGWIFLFACKLQRSLMRTFDNAVLAHKTLKGHPNRFDRVNCQSPSFEHLMGRLHVEDSNQYLRDPNHGHNEDEALVPRFENIIRCVNIVGFQVETSFFDGV